MKINQLHLKNFRCYEKLTVSFQPDLTVLVAINGEGKTTVLDALRIGFWSFVSQFDLAKTAYNDPANTLTIDDVRILPLGNNNDQMARQLPSKISLQANFANDGKESESVNLNVHKRLMEKEREKLNS